MKQQAHNPIPDTVVRDPNAAWYAAHAEKGVREAAQGALEEGNEDLARMLSVVADQAGTFALQAYAASPDAPLDTDAIADHASAETVKNTEVRTPEQLRELLKDKFLIGKGYLSGRHINDEVGVTGKGHNELTDSIFGDPRRDIKASKLRRMLFAVGSFGPVDGTRPCIFDENMQRVDYERVLRELDAPEVVTIAPLDGRPVGGYERTNRSGDTIRDSALQYEYSVPERYGDIFPESPHANEKVYVVDYRTMQNRDPKFEHIDPYTHRGGHMIYATALLPETEAVQLFEAMKSNPELAREFYRESMLDIGVEETDVANAMPPYEAWRAASGGTSHMVFRTAFDEVPNQGNVVTF